MKVFKNSVLYSAAGVSPMVASFAIMPLYTRYLTVANFGLITLLNMLISVIATVLSLQLSASLVRAYPESNDQEVSNLFGTLFKFLILISVLYVVVVYAWGKHLYSYVFWNVDISTELSYLVVLISIFSVFDTFIKNHLKAKENGRAIFISSIISMFLNVGVGCVLIIRFEMGVPGFFYASLMSLLGQILFNFCYVPSVFKSEFQLKVLNSSLKYSLPLIAYALGNYLYLYSDRLILEKFVETSSIGLYGVGDKFSSVIKVGFTAVMTAVVPLMFRTVIKSGQRSFLYDALRIYLPLAGGVVIIYLIALRFFIFNFLGDGFEMSFSYAVPLSLSYYIKGAFNIVIVSFFVDKKNLITSTVALVWGGVNVALNLCFIPAYGAWAAAGSTLASFLGSLITVMSITFFRFPIGENRNKFFLSFGTSLVLLSLVSWMMTMELWGGDTLSLSIIAGLVMLFIGVKSLVVYKENYKVEV